jgi:hypothetical protein
MNAATTIDAPAIAGTPFEGGFYAGRYRIGEDTFALIVSPKASGTLKGQWGKLGKDVEGARSFGDGRANTGAMAAAGSALAKKAMALDINGFSDWYIPARDELELIYRHLKPTADANFRLSGDNPSATPPTWPYSADAPTQTTDEAFRKGGAEALDDDWHWSSTQYSALSAWVQTFSDGCQHLANKGGTGRARAVRRFKLNP